MKYLKWFWLLLKTMILRKSQLKVSFTKESDRRWYVDFPNWPLSHDNLEMVAGPFLGYKNGGKVKIKRKIIVTK